MPDVVAFFSLQVEECTDTFNFELAQKFCERALDLEPDNVEILQTTGVVSLELEEAEKAITVSFE